YRLEEMELNSDVQDFGAYIHEDKFYFVSARNESRRKYKWNGQPTLDVYVATKSGGEFQEPKLLKGDVNTKYNEGNVAIANDNKTLYFTRNDFTDRKYKKSKEGINQLKVYRARNVDGNWTDIDELPFNSSEFSTGQVALSPDGKTLYFASDRPGGQGDADLYKVSIDEDGNFGEPVNLGPGINTPGKEGFPFVAADGTLYFASDGLQGLGGLDVFKAEPQGEGFGTPQNLGAPVNSSSDDFAFAYYPDEKQGYVSSNRSGVPEDGKTADDNIYKVIKLQFIKIYAEVKDSETDEPVANADVSIYNDNDEKVDQVATDQDGNAVFEVKGGDSEYSLQAAADDYKPYAQDVPHKEEGDINIAISLEPVEKKIREKEIVLKEIHFEFDKSDITKEGAFELDKLVDIMKAHPAVEVHVVAHTDNIGSKSYNQKLSERRAESIVEYVHGQGISPSR